MITKPASASGCADSNTMSPLSGALPLKRLVQPEDIADAAVYLATATAVTGAVFNIDAGRDL